MKMICPVCGVEGTLQVRGNSKRVQHYVDVKKINEFIVIME
jgi:hypothetical protein